MENTAIQTTTAQVVPAKRKCGLVQKIAFAMTATNAMAAATAVTAFAKDWDSVKVADTDSVSAATAMGKIIGILLTISRYVGVALVVYGVYEVVMSFMQNQPEAKTKGIVMALAGIVLTTLKSILGKSGLGLLS